MVIYMNLPMIFDKYINQKHFHFDRIGKSNSSVYLFDDFVLKVQLSSIEAENELQMLQWLKDKIKVPDVIEHTIENGYSYILMAKCTGDMSCSEKYMTAPIKQAELLAEVLHQLWGVSIESCPCTWLLEKRLSWAEHNIASGYVNITNAQTDAFSCNGFKNPEELLHWLIENKPGETAVISHGDFCLPNIFINDEGLTGLIDLGKTGVADMWQDIALCFRSLSNNYNGMACIDIIIAYPYAKRNKIFILLRSIYSTIKTKSAQLLSSIRPAVDKVLDFFEKMLIKKPRD